MLTDNQTNFLYLADSLPQKYPDFSARFESLLRENNIPFAYLQGTKDVWAVDYMPIQISENKFVQFVYNPDYLQSKKYLETISDVDAICNSINLKHIKSDIILDGGNVIKWKDKVIMCEKIFRENPHYTKAELTNKLQEIFEVKTLIFVPWQKDDEIGHADGMIRFLDGKTVIINNLSNEKTSYQNAFKTVLENAELDYIEIPFNPYQNKKMIHANGIYINYLQMKDVIIVPVFGMKEDEMAIKQFESIFPGSNILTIESNEIAYEGGILNCISWNIFR